MTTQTRQEAQRVVDEGFRRAKEWRSDFTNAALVDVVAEAITAAKAHIEGRDAVLEEAIEAVRPFVVESPWGHTEKSNNKVCDEIIAALSALKSSQTQAPAIGGEEQETGPENSREEMSPVLNGTLDCEPARVAPATPPRRPAG